MCCMVVSNRIALSMKLLPNCFLMCPSNIEHSKYGKCVCVYIYICKTFLFWCLSTDCLQQQIPVYNSRLCKCLCPLFLVLFFRCRIMYVV